MRERERERERETEILQRECMSKVVERHGVEG